LHCAGTHVQTNLLEGVFDSGASHTSLCQVVAATALGVDVLSTGREFDATRNLELGTWNRTTLLCRRNTCPSQFARYVATHSCAETYKPIVYFNSDIDPNRSKTAALARSAPAGHKVRTVHHFTRSQSLNSNKLKFSMRAHGSTLGPRKQPTKQTNTQPAKQAQKLAFLY
jgi:hypothetical protein